MLLWIGCVGIGAVVFGLVYRQLQNMVAIAEKASLGVAEDVPVRSLVLRYGKKLYRGFIMSIARSIVTEDKEKALQRKLITAGALEILPPVEYVAFRILLGVGVPLVAFVYTVLFQAGISWWMIIGLSVFGWFYPFFWVRGLGNRRKREISLALPFVIDMLTLSTEAGMDFMGAIQKVVEKARPNPLVAELDRVLKEVQLGASRQEALRNMAWRIDLETISSFVAILVTADQMGASIGQVLRTQSDLLRNQRFLKAEKAGAAASQKILFPLIFLILPAVFIMIFGPVVLQFVYGGR